jgi:hypothetical protein
MNLEDILNEIERRSEFYYNKMIEEYEKNNKK